MRQKLGIVVEGNLTIPPDYPPVGEVVSIKLTAQVTGTEPLPIRQSVLVIKGHLMVALTYSADTSAHSLTYLKLKLPFVNYVPDLAPGEYATQVLYQHVEPQHTRALYYSVALELKGGI